jgi:hypothetical protein
MLVWYIIYVSAWYQYSTLIDGSNMSTRGYQNSNINQLFTFSGYVKVREDLYRVWIGSILNYIGTT